jgi:hypothetical protein
MCAIRARAVFGGGMRLRDAVVVQRIIGAALKQALPVPVGRAVAQADEGALRRTSALISTCW